MAGMNFLDVKLTIYYIPLFTGGYLFGQLQERISTIKYAKTVMPAVYAICLGVWLWLLLHMQFFAVEMTSSVLVMRYIASILGAIFVISCISGNYRLEKVLGIAGVYSLEIYLTHYLFLNLLTSSQTPIFSSSQGFLMIILNYTITLTLTSLVIILTKRNPVLSKALYFKRAKNTLQ